MTVAVAVRPLRAEDIRPLVGVLGRAYGSEQNFELRLQRLHATVGARTPATFVAELAGVPVGMVVGIDYGEVAYVAQMAVDPAMQRRGIGTKLMDGLTDWLDAGRFRATELDATPAGVPLYRRYGFVPADDTEVFGSTALCRAAGGARPYTPGDRPALFALDARAFGADRSAVLGSLIDEAPHAVVVCGAADAIDAFAVAQPRTGLLGPVVATDSATAAAAIDAARVHLPALHRISVPTGTIAAAPMLAQRGYRFLRSLVHMVRGERPEARREYLFARINLGQG